MARRERIDHFKILSSNLKSFSSFFCETIIIKENIYVEYSHFTEPMFAFNKLLILAITLVFSFQLWINPVQASIPLNDQLKANFACEAFQSIRRRTNPGNIKITPDNIYPVTAKNKQDETHYLLKIEDATPQQRWVDISCGTLLGTPPVTPPKSPNPTNLLAISWQPAFCETHEDKKECETQTTARFDASNFTLHGLWPKPQYCNVDNDIKKLDRPKTWLKLPPISLSDELFKELQEKMPGVTSGLHRHEWYKHGTCYSDTAEEYYRESLALLDQVNNSEVRELFESNIGEVLRSDEILDEFDTAFGNSASKKVGISCTNDKRPTNRRMIVELKLNLKGEIEPDTAMSDLFKEGRRVNNVCSSGEIDPAGLDELTN